jgi:hypothetical protein
MVWLHDLFDEPSFLKTHPAVRSGPIDHHSARYLFVADDAAGRVSLIHLFRETLPAEGQVAANARNHCSFAIAKKAVGDGPVKPYLNIFQEDAG